MTISTRTSTQGSDSTTFAVTLPDGSNVSGKRVIVVASKDGTETVTWPSGWTEFRNGNGTETHISCGYRDIDGTEGFDGTDDQITLSTSTAQQWNAHSYLLTSDEFDSATAPEAATVVNGTNNGTTNPPSLTPSWGSATNLWIAVSALRFAGNWTAAPTDYTNLLSNNGGDSNAPLGTARRVLSGTSEDPGTFSHDGGNTAWAATTIAVKPSSGGGSVTGSLSETQDNQTLAASGTAGAIGSVAETQDNQTLAATGQLGYTGSVAETQDNQTLAATGTAGAIGLLSETQDDQTLAATGTVTPPGETTGSLAETQDNQTLAATGTAGAIGSLAETQDNQTLAATGQLGYTGSVAETQDDQTLTASGTVAAGASGSVAETQDDQTLTASGTVTAPEVPSPGWWGLKAILDQRRAEFVRSQIDDEQRCPYDGELLHVSTSGVPFCPFDGPIRDRVVD